MEVGDVYPRERPGAADGSAPTGAGKGMARKGKMIPDDLLESLRVYIRAAAETHSGFGPDERGYGRICSNDDPVMVMLQERLHPMAEMLFGMPLKRSYSFTIIYDEKGVLPSHTDRPDAPYSLDICIHDTAPETPWKLYIEGEGHSLGPGEGIAFRGCEQVHWREGSPRPGQEIIMAFFHFVGG